MSVELYKNKGKAAHLAVPVEAHRYETKKTDNQEYKSLCGSDTLGMERSKEDNIYLLSFPCEECEKQLDWIKQSMQKSEV
jgi:hypothetical protein